MKVLARMVGSFFLTAVLFVIGGFLRHPSPCFDCFEPHGFPFTYRQDGGYAGGAAFYRGWMVADIVAFALLTTLIACGWNWIAATRRRSRSG
jgi:hypothetical protein